jgi:hypothetical protein
MSKEAHLLKQTKKRSCQEISLFIDQTIKKISRELFDSNPKNIFSTTPVSIHQYKKAKKIFIHDFIDFIFDFENLPARNKDIQDGEFGDITDNFLIELDKIKLKYKNKKETISFQDICFFMKKVVENFNFDLINHYFKESEIDKKYKERLKNE